MTMWLKQNTSVVVQFGPFLDKTDGVTLETAIAAATLDHLTTGIMISKNGGTLAVRNGTPTASAYDAHGMYKITLNTTDTGTLGTLRMVFTDATTHLPVWQDFMVVTANVWDSLFGADTLQADVTQFNGTAGTFSGGRPEVNASHFAGTAYATALAAEVDAVWDEAMAGHVGADSAGLVLNDWQDAGRLDAILDTIAADVVNIDGAAMRGTDSAALASTFTGITSLAEWLGLLAGKQVGNATARTEIRATGAGAGTYDETTDSLEAGQAEHDVTQSALTTIDDFLDTEIAAILEDTGTTIPATLGTPAGASMSADIAAIEAQTDDIGVAGAGLTAITGVTLAADQAVNVTKISGSATAADNLEASALGIVPSSVNDAAATATAFISALTEATDDHYNGRIIVFTSGAVAGQATDITDYAGATKTITMTALTEAPANGVTFVIV